MLWPEKSKSKQGLLLQLLEVSPTHDPFYFPFSVVLFSWFISPFLLPSSSLWLIKSSIPLFPDSSIFLDSSKKVSLPHVTAETGLPPKPWAFREPHWWWFQHPINQGLHFSAERSEGQKNKRGVRGWGYDKGVVSTMAMHTKWMSRGESWSSQLRACEV